MIRVWSLRVVAVINVLLLFFAFNPWIEEWTSEALVALALELIFLLLVGVPVFLYQFIGRKKPFGRSVRDSVEAIMDFVTGAI